MTATVIAKDGDASPPKPTPLKSKPQQNADSADEYDAAQERKEIRRAGNPNCSGTEQLPGPGDVGLTRKQVHEARCGPKSGDQRGTKNPLEAACADRRIKRSYIVFI